MKRWMQSLVLAITASLLLACASSSPDVIQRGDAQRLSKVEDGVVQARGTEVFVPGDAVILVTTGGKVRIAKAPR